MAAAARSGHGIASPAPARSARILLIAPHAEQAASLTLALQQAGHVVHRVSSLARPYRLVDEGSIDVIVAETDLPEPSVLRLIRDLREHGVGRPMLLVANTSSITGRVNALDAGADDVITRPFALAELRARVRALARRSDRQPMWVSAQGSIALDFERRRATVGENPVRFTAREWSILAVLAAAGGQVVPRSRILEELWGHAGDAGSASLDVLFVRIRKKLGPGAIRTLRGGGFALE